MTGPRGLPGFLLCAVLALGTTPGIAQQPPSGAAPQPPAATAPPPAVPDGKPEETVDAEALVLLNRMAETLAQAQRLGVTIRASYDVTQDTGEKVEFGERRVVTLNRPDQLRIEVQESDGHRRMVGFDGKAITVFDPDENAYGQLDKPGSVDDAVHALIRDLQIRLPLALLFVTTLPAEMDQRLASLEYVERDTLTRVPTDHLSGSTEGVDFQVWIAASGPPLPERVVITYSDDEGAPQYRADFSEWRMNADVPSTDLAFRPPDGAERVPFLVRVQQAGNHSPTNQHPPGQHPPGQHPASQHPANGTPAAPGSTGGPSK
ncbi:DUF2092 domain-containing protein [Azospirillum doebereinerae]